LAPLGAPDWLVAAILWGVLLLDYLADRHDDPAPRAPARRIETAVAAALTAGAAGTADVGRHMSTVEATRAIHGPSLAPFSSPATFRRRRILDIII
jgi:hypothetical protein